MNVDEEFEEIGAPWGSHYIPIIKSFIDEFLMKNLLVLALGKSPGLATEVGGPHQQQGRGHRKHLDAMDEILPPAEPGRIVHLVLEENAYSIAELRPTCAH